MIWGKLRGRCSVTYFHVDDSDAVCRCPPSWRDGLTSYSSERHCACSIYILLLSTRDGFCSLFGKTDFAPRVVYQKLYIYVSNPIYSFKYPAFTLPYICSRPIKPSSNFFQSRLAGAHVTTTQESFFSHRQVGHFIHRTLFTSNPASKAPMTMLATDLPCDHRTGIFFWVTDPWVDTRPPAHMTTISDAPCEQCAQWFFFSFTQRGTSAARFFRQG
jgi:hypothetical protein